eukprot:TRINITY_DN10273_c0_g1_i1.p1 TRINITY_DN10273_c0_g1~~TRINITY_DN10273_c0_g1_i1.p1  ORF type:complete len:200 (-),score=83.40 TRINITY_DN10273_c0_g1_i1:56-655(-)
MCIRDRAEALEASVVELKAASAEQETALWCAQAELEPLRGASSGGDSAVRDALNQTKLAETQAKLAETQAKLAETQAKLAEVTHLAEAAEAAHAETLAASKAALTAALAVKEAPTEQESSKQLRAELSQAHAALEGVLHEKSVLRASLKDAKTEVAAVRLAGQQLHESRGSPSSRTKAPKLKQRCTHSLTQLMHKLRSP